MVVGKWLFFLLLGVVLFCICCGVCCRCLSVKGCLWWIVGLVCVEFVECDGEYVVCESVGVFGFIWLVLFDEGVYYVEQELGCDGGVEVSLYGVFFLCCVDDVGDLLIECVVLFECVMFDFVVVLYM